MSKAGLLLLLLSVGGLPTLVFATCQSAGSNYVTFIYESGGNCNLVDNTATCILAHGSNTQFGTDVTNPAWLETVSIHHISPENVDSVIHPSLEGRGEVRLPNSFWEQVPSSGAGSVQHVHRVRLVKTNNNNDCWERSLTINLQYGYNQAEYNNRHSAAQSAISSAQTSASALSSKITEAGNYGLPASSYQQLLSSAQSLLSQAQTKLQNAESEATGPLYDAAVADADLAVSFANQAKQSADSSITQITTALSVPLQFSITPTKPSVSLYNGQSETVTVQVSSQDSRIMTCTYQGSTGSSSLGTIQPASSQSFPISLTAPNQGSGSQTFSTEVRCQVGSYVQGTKTTSITLQYRSNPAQTAINEARDAINISNSQIQSFEIAIQNATSQDSALDAFLSEVRQYLERARTAKSQAESNLANAQRTYSGGDSDGALSQATQAKSYAQSVSQYVETGKTLLVKAMEDIKTEGGRTQLLVSSAESRISSAEQWIQRADSEILSATALGMDTKDAEAKVAAAKGSLTNSRTYLQTAKSALSSRNFEIAKNNAQAAETNAMESEAKAKEAYEMLSSITEGCEIASQSMQSAQSEISNVDRIYTNLAEIIKGMSKKVETTNMKADVEAQRQKIDAARNDYSAAQNKVSAGYCTQAVDQAISARDKGAEASNQLTRVAERIKDQVMEHIVPSVQDVKSKIEGGQKAINDASGVFGIDSSKIASAQQQISEAQGAVAEAETNAQSAKAATTLNAFLDKAAMTFSKINEAEEKVEKGKKMAIDAVNETYIKYGIAAGAAGVAGAGAAGVGFMWWRSRKKKKQEAESKNKGEVSTEKAEKEDKIEKLAKKYMKSGNLKKAADTYAKAGRFAKAADLYQQLSNGKA